MVDESNDLNQKDFWLWKMQEQQDEDERHWRGHYRTDEHSEAPHWMQTLLAKEQALKIAQKLPSFPDKTGARQSYDKMWRDLNFEECVTDGIENFEDQ